MDPANTKVLESDTGVEDTQALIREKTPAQRLVGLVRQAVQEGLLADLRSNLAALHPADFADLIEYLDREDRRALVDQVGEMFVPEVLAELHEDVREAVVDWLPDQVVQTALQALEVGEAAEIAEELSAADRSKYLEGMEAGDRAALDQTLAYPEYSAGRLMTRDFVVVPQGWTVGQAIDFLRAEDSEELPKDFYLVYLVDPGHRPVAAVTLSRIMREPRAARLEALALAELRSFVPTFDQEDMAFKFRQYGLVEAPVVMEGTGQILGVVRVDDVIEVIEEEAEDDLLKLVGLRGGELDVQESWWRTSRSRFVWLFVNLITVVIAAAVIAQFSDLIEAYSTLAVLLPIVASMGGNSGTQTLAVAVRGLATKELSLQNAGVFVRKELLVGLMNGLAFAVLTAAAVMAIYGEPALALTIALAMVLNLIVAPLSGTLIPIALERQGIDPANASTVFLTTITDVVGFFAFLGLAGLLFL